MTKSKKAKRKERAKLQQRKNQHRTSSNTALKIEESPIAKVAEPIGKRIEVKQLVTPMRFNRVSFQAASDGIREESLNYYLPTSILHAVKSIKGFANYLKIKTRLNKGEYFEPESVKPLKIVDKVIPQIYLERTADKTKIDYMYDEEGYMICEPFDTGGAEQWTLVHYLYRMYSLDGFADMTIDRIGYKVRNEPIPQWDIDLIIAIQGNHLIIGKI